MISFMLMAALAVNLVILLWCCCELAGAWMDALEHPARPARRAPILQVDPQRREDIRRLARTLAARDGRRA